MKIWLHFVIQDGKNLPGNMQNIDTPKNKTCRYGDSDTAKDSLTMFLWMCGLPSALESSRLGVKSWLWRIFSTTSSASTRVSSILFSWDSMESCFTGCLRGGYESHFLVNLTTNGFHHKLKMLFVSSYWIYISFSAKQGCGQPVSRGTPSKQLEMMPVLVD